MIKFENTEVWGFEHALRGMRNPKNSWNRNDGKYENGEYIIGENDLKLVQRLCNAGSEHRKFMRQIFVSVDITAPLYWWKEMDTYKVGTVANSCSTMHKIHEKKFTLDDFSCEHLFKDNAVTVHHVHNDFRVINNTQWLMFTIDLLNVMRECYLETKDKKYWWQMIQLLPSSYNQKRTVTMNYENIYTMYRQRKNHKLDEWSKGFIKWVESLPCAKELILCEPYMEA